MSSGEGLPSLQPQAAPPTPPPNDPPSTQSSLSTFERVICSNPPILDSLFAQITTEDAFHLYHTNSYLRNSLRSLPTAWRFISWRLYQPAAPIPASNANNPGVKQTGNYALDQLLINVINPYSTCLQSLELDNTAVSGGTLTQTVLILRRGTLQHLSVRGCKNVSLKYHINPWLQIHALAKEGSGAGGLFPYDKLALKSLYTYRCRHHRRRPYPPSSLTRKESDSEPTHELVKTCHSLGIWTDTAWCTTPGSRCFRRRGYVAMRAPADPREVWVVYDRLWRSKNWLGLSDSASQSSSTNGRKPDARFWITNEKAHKGESISVTGEGKNVPMHLRKSHRKFVEDVQCTNCGDSILERCEQCSVTMHCSGCRKTLCASCAFDRPYLRNKNATESERNKFWWAPGCAVSPCTMQDQDIPPPQGPPHAPNGAGNAQPNIRFKWCCSEPVFSGGGGITYPSGSNRDCESLRAAPLPKGEGWEDSDFVEPDSSSEDGDPACNCKPELAGRWKGLCDFFARNFDNHQHSQPVSSPVPRVLCDECHSSETWRINCKGCTLPLCVKHDMRDRLKVRICGFKDLSHEMRDYSLQRKRWEQKWERISEQLKLIEPSTARSLTSTEASSSAVPQPTPDATRRTDRLVALLRHTGPAQSSLEVMTATPHAPEIAAPSAVPTDALIASVTDLEVPGRPLSRGSNCTDSASRSSSPAPSASTMPATPEPKSAQKKAVRKSMPVLQPAWKGCYSFFCPAIRPFGDHRRRCIAVMRQCSECKVNVCGECVGTIGPCCPCRGCQVPSAEDGTSNGSESALFFCANCRWSRMACGKCKKFTEAFLAAQTAQSGRSHRQKKSSKVRKPVESRRASHLTAVNWDEAAEFLSDFADMQIEGTPSLEERNADLQLAREDGEIQEIEDVGQLARELITRIQVLRGQFRPGSLAALALPDVRLIDDGQSIILNQPTESEASSEDPSA